VFVAAAPDSYRGAYLLRNGLGFALHRLGIPSVHGAVILSHYLIEDPLTMPVLVRVDGGQEVHVAGRDGRAEVMVGALGLEDSAGVWVSGMHDRFGRHREARFRLKRRGLVLVASPGGVERLGMAGPAAGSGAPGEGGDVIPPALVRQ
jgi:hypothetical protein